MNEQIARITKEAEEKYPITMQQDLRISIANNSLRKAYIAGATAYAERAEKLRECLQEISMIVTNGAYNSEILEKKINSALNNDL